MKGVLNKNKGPSIDKIN